MRRLCILAVVLAVAVAGLAGCGAQRVARDTVPPAVELAPGAAETAGGGEVAEEMGSESASTSAEPAPLSRSWSEPEVIPGTKGASSVEIGVDAAGNVVAVWLGRGGAHVAIQSAETGAWTLPTRLRHADRDSGLSLAVASNGAFVLAWLGPDRRRVYAVSGTPELGIRPPVAIGPGHEAPEVGISADGVATVAWGWSDSLEFIPARSAVRTRRVDVGTGAWERVVPLATRLSGNVQEVAVNAAGDAAVLWDACENDRGIVAACSPLRMAVRSSNDPIWKARRVAPVAEYYDTENRGLGIAGDGAPTAMWVGRPGADRYAEPSVYAGAVEAGGWVKTPLSGPGVHVYPSYVSQPMIALDVDEQGRAVAVWLGRADPDSCAGPQAIEAAVRSDATANWQTPVRLATIEDSCSPATYPSALLARQTVFAAWLESREVGSTVRLASLGLDDAAPATPVAFDAHRYDGRPALAANESDLVVAAWSEERGIVATFNRAEP